MSKLQKTSIISYLILSFVALIVFMLSIHVIWTADCVTYSFSFANGEQVNTVGDIFRSQYAHYLYISGRYVAHWLCQLFLCIAGQSLFSVVNALFYPLLIITIIKYTGGDWRNWRTLLTAVILVLLFCDTDYIPTCQIGYVWMSTLVIFYLYLFFDDTDIINSKSVFFLVLLAVFSVVAGNAHESINIGVGGSLCLYVLFNIRKISLSQWIMFIGFCVGFLFLCLSPGSINRANIQHIPMFYSLLTLISNLRVTYLFIAIFIYKVIFRSIDVKKFYLSNSFAIITILIILIFNVIVGVGNGRQLFGIEAFSAILIIKLMNDGAFNDVWLIGGGICVILFSAIKYNEESKAKDAYEKLWQIVINNNGEDAYIDFPAFSEFVHPVQTIRYGINLDYVISSIQRASSGQLHPEIENFNVFPKSLEHDSDCHENKVVEYLPGEFLVRLSNDSPCDIKIKRKLNILGLKISIPDAIITPENGNFINLDSCKVVYIPYLNPLIENKEVFLSH